MTDQTARDMKLVQYLNEAYGKEKQLETALQAHIAMTTRAPYRKRLREHLTETKRHAREVERRIKRLGGEAQVVDLPGPAALSEGVGAAVELGSRALAAAKGPLHAVRGTGEQEKMLKNAKTEYSEEHEEIATYSAIETLASSLGDTETAKLARAIRREEERMASFLAKLIPTLTGAVVREELPASERRPSSRKPARRKAAGRTAARPRAASSANSRGAAGAKRAAGRKAKPTGATSKRRGSSAAPARAAAGAAKRAPAVRKATTRSRAKRATASRPRARAGA